MAAITGDDALKLNYPYQRVRRNSIRLNLFRKVVKATAQINQNIFAYPLAEITVDNTSAGWANVREGELFEIRNGSGVVVYTDTHRRNPDSTKLYLSRIRGGTDQRARFTASLLADNYTITSYTVQLPASFVSRIDETTPVTTILKRVDRELNLTTPQSSNPKPQVNYGTWQQADAGAGGTAQFAINASSSFSLVGGSLAYTQDPPSGISIVSGLTTDAAVTIQAAAPGQYIYNIQVKDSAIDAGSQQSVNRGFRYLFVNGTGYPAFNDQYTVQVLSDVETMIGRTISFRAYGAGAVDELYADAPVCLTYELEFSQDGTTWVQLSAGLRRRTFVGYIADIPAVHVDVDGVAYVDFTAQSPLILCDRLPIVDQLLEQASPVTTWQQTTAALMHAMYACYFAVSLHAPVTLYLHDFTFSSGANTFFSNPFPIKGGSVANAVKALAERMGFGFFTCSSDGRLSLMRNPNAEDATYRNSLANVWTWINHHLDAEEGIEYALNYYLSVKDTTGSFTWYSGGTNDVAQARSNLYAPSQATSGQSLPDHIALNKNDGLARVGHMHQRANRPVLGIDFRANTMAGEYVAPADLEWHTMNFPALDNADVGVFALRHLPTQLIRTWGDDLTIRYNPSFEPETSGQPADEIIYLEPGVPPPIPVSYSFCDPWLGWSASIPLEWSGLVGSVNTASWLGDTTGLMANWQLATQHSTRGFYRTTSGGGGTTYCGVRMDTNALPEQPIRITSLYLEARAVSGLAAGSDRRLAIAVKPVGSNITVLANTLFNNVGNATLNVSWTGDLEVEGGILFFHSGTDGTPSFDWFSITRTDVNCE